MTAVVAGLPRSWQTAPSMTAICCGRCEVVDALARLVDDLQRVDPDVALRMPFGLLRTAGERLELRKQLLDDAELHRERQADRRPRRQQQLLDFAPDALGRQVVERECRGTASRASSSSANSNRAANWTARSTRRLSSPNVAGSTTRRSRRSMSPRPSKGSRYSSVSGSHAMALIVKSRRRAASVERHRGIARDYRSRGGRGPTSTRVAAARRRCRPTCRPGSSRRRFRRGRCDSSSAAQAIGRRRRRPRCRRPSTSRPISRSRTQPPTISARPPASRTASAICRARSREPDPLGPADCRVAKDPAYS